MMISWLNNEQDRAGRERIINRVLQDFRLLSCKNHMLSGVLTGIYGRLYKYYANNNIKKMKRVLNILVLYKKATIMKGNVMERLASEK